MTSASVVLPASPPAISQPSSLDVCQAPWTGSLTVQAPLSSEEQRFRIMLAARDIMIDSVLLDRFLDEEEPIDFSRNASVVFARLPSGYFALLVRSIPQELAAETEYINVIFTSAVLFSWKEASHF
ncbi:hypothetical protein FOMPIDRAFT_1055448 [Fomitopsis schrenkii]|uniref:Uncharacterized protein n=1 Tax=Fomitopsis schrenkii TaxID=2126942 RepID=S8F4Z1_FOMSC|nr:hypothetical protein FOMPIDRAFT_1055448 [Fomitopsis schrenkii]